jgi:hypothetical protein
MDALDAIARALPDLAQRARRRFWRDPEFRSVCEDYRDACAALERLELATAADRDAIEDYRVLVAEFLAEATELLNRASVNDGEGA